MVHRSYPTRPYADLWREWWDAHRAKGDGPECLQKVKTHTTAADVGTRISAIDRLGNDLADAAAKRAVARFPFDVEASERYAVAERAVTAWAQWIGILGTLEIEEDCERHQAVPKVTASLLRRWVPHAEVLAHIPYWDAEDEIWRCSKCGRPSAGRAALLND